ncbi:MAG: site-specific DNA-methyltransferase [Rhodobacter sp.]|nr:site-specific DNA-methyltransferase [Rhodobacter sp.]
MAAIHDLLKQITDPKLRERIAREWEDATRHKKFGLVYEQHLPEVVPIYSAKPRRGDLVAKRGGNLTETWRVRRIESGLAHLMKPRQAGEKESAGERITLPVAELLVVKQFGDPIFPTLVPMDAVQNGPADAPWHTLIEADNYHALQLLEYLYAGKVDCIYIDPPYNTGARDWKYNNDYVDGNDGWRHSKWLSFMEKRLRLAKKLLKPDTGVLICTIDEHEVHHLGNLMSEIFPECNRQMATIVINQKGVSQGRLARVEEYALYAFMPSAILAAHHDDLLSGDRSEQKRFQTPRWEWLLRGGSNSRREDRHLLFYPIFVEPETKRITGVGVPLPLDQVPSADSIQDKRVAWPIRRDGSFGNWQVGPSSFTSLIEQGMVRLGGYDKKRSTWTVQYLNRGTRKRIENGEIVVTGKDERSGSLEIAYASSESRLRNIKAVWFRGTHDSGIYGSSLLKNIIGDGGSFTFPKSLYSTKDAVASVVRNNKQALVVDFFAGSGTTLNAVYLLNALDEGNRRCILVTNNEVSADAIQGLKESGHSPGDEHWEAHGICRSVTWPRSKFTVLGKRDDGTALPSEYLTGMMVDREKRRTFRFAEFVAPEDFRVTAGLSPADLKKAERAVHVKKLAFVGMIDALPQNSVTPGCRFIVTEDHKASVLFDPEAAAEWLEALDEQDHITDFYIVAEDDNQFKAIKAQVDDLLGPLIVQQEEKRPMSAGFAANVAYFKLDFLDKDRVELGAAFREILPLLWMKAGAIGPTPTLPAGRLPDFFIPEGSPFAVLLTETRVAAFQQALQTRKQLRHVFIVTDAEEAFRALSADLRSTLAADSPEAEFVQLYRDYLVNFTINTRADNAALGQGGAA